MLREEKSHQDDDAQILARLGYKQELQRHFTPLEVFGIGFSIMGLLPSIASTISFALPNGGPTTLVWGWAVASTFILIVALALGELASAAPTSGGLYFWTFKYAPPRSRNILSWVVGYANTMGNVAGAASTMWGCAVQLVAAVSIGSNMTFIPTTGSTYGVYIALLLLAGVISSGATRLVARLQGIYVVLNILLCLAIIIALPVATPREFKNTASYAFGGFSNRALSIYAFVVLPDQRIAHTVTGWPSGFAFVLGFMTPLWSIGGFDAPIHISEEASNARTAVPWALVSAVGTTGLLGWVVNIVVAFHMGTDMSSILESPIGQPMAAIFFNSFGTRPTLAVWSVVVAVQFMMATSAYISVSRQIFAFSRDGALPFSSFLYRINRRTQTPSNAVWGAIAAGALLCLLAFAGPQAINAVFSVAVTAQYIAFGVPIASRVWAELCRGGEEEMGKGQGRWEPGPFRLGRMSLPIAALAILWSSFAVVLVMFPASPGPNAQNMNYTVVVGGGWAVVCLGYYYVPVVGGQVWFRGPVRNVQVGTVGGLEGGKMRSRSLQSEGSEEKVEEIDG
ncbi:APC amino acid permease [Trametopsis cervina]|nr:APC amino acid permease [Trametopsis cervina]